MEALVAADQLVGEGKTRHQTTLLEPEDGTEGSREEYSFHASESDQSFREGCLAADISLGPPCLLLYTGDAGMGREKLGPFGRVGDVSVNQEAVGFLMNRLHRHLETIKTPRLWYCHLPAETLCEIFNHNAVGPSKEGQHHGYEVLFVRRQFLVPVGEVGRQVDLIGRPERRHVLLVHRPKIGVFDREERKSRSLLIGSADWLVLQRWIHRAAGTSSSRSRSRRFRCRRQRILWRHRQFCGFALDSATSWQG